MADNRPCDYREAGDDIIDEQWIVTDSKKNGILLYPASEFRRLERAIESTGEECGRLFNVADEEIKETQKGLNKAIEDFGMIAETLEDQTLAIQNRVTTAEARIEQIGRDTTQAVADEKTRAEAQENGIRESITEAVNILESSIEAVDAKVDTLETKVDTDIAKAIEDLEGSIAVEKARAEGVESTLNSAINGVEGKVDANTANIVSLTNSKADKTDLDRVEGKVDGKADESDLNDLRYTVNLKANTSDVNRELDKKANTSSVNAELNTLRESIDTKANANETYTKTQVDNALALKANSVDVDNALALKANANDVNTALNGKADKSTTYTKTEVDNKVDAKVFIKSFSLTSSDDIDDLSSYIDFTSGTPRGSVYLFRGNNDVKGTFPPIPKQQFQLYFIKQHENSSYFTEFLFFSGESNGFWVRKNLANNLSNWIKVYYYATNTYDATSEAPISGKGVAQVVGNIESLLAAL